MQADCNPIWKDLFDNVDKDEVVLNSCPRRWDRILQARETKVRGVHLDVSVDNAPLFHQEERGYLGWLLPPAAITASSRPFVS